MWSSMLLYSVSCYTVFNLFWLSLHLRPRVAVRRVLLHEFQASPRVRLPQGRPSIIDHFDIPKCSSSLRVYDFDFGTCTCPPSACTLTFLVR
ncbi:hypothetical protein CYLTODRAFT_125550 [Cylindrobasidium torrendii FP15055 ss-10]|uniref:Uncharacterized protein n=1 Tax=Cylindrobasidium torrendii FP15055 ss-10 TaxID=1314674 RepID=A0A0D7AZJ0_9AGAR|nr:hypothetical protein CYLTODRAFT_125550 [Cylindrobasidium torrendii FP15055 ss-10]